MSEVKSKNFIFTQGLSKLGFDSEDDSLLFTDTPLNKLPSAQIVFHLEKAKDFGATAVYLRRQLNGSYKSQVYLFNRDSKKNLE